MNVKLLEQVKKCILKDHKTLLDIEPPDWVMSKQPMPDWMGLRKHLKFKTDNTFLVEDIARILDIPVRSAKRLLQVDRWQPTIRKSYRAAKTTKQKAKVIAERISLFIASGGAM